MGGVMCVCVCVCVCACACVRVCGVPMTLYQKCALIHQEKLENVCGSHNRQPVETKKKFFCSSILGQ